MYQPYIRQKIFEARARELERIAAEDRAAHADAAPARRLNWAEHLRRRRTTVPRAARADAGGPPAKR